MPCPGGRTPKRLLCDLSTPRGPQEPRGVLGPIERRAQPTNDRHSRDRNRHPLGVLFPNPEWGKNPAGKEMREPMGQRAAAACGRIGLAE